MKQLDWEIEDRQHATRKREEAKLTQQPRPNDWTAGELSLVAAARERTQRSINLILGLPNDKAKAAAEELINMISTQVSAATWEPD